MNKIKSQKQLQVGEQIRRAMANIFLRDDIFNSNAFKATIADRRRLEPCWKTKEHEAEEDQNLKEMEK